MSCFKLPVSVCEDLTSLISNFWWSSGNTYRGMKWVKWRTLCQSKSRGGLGFRNLEAFNLALLAKQGWRIVKNPSSLVARMLKAKYFPHTDFWNAERKDSASYVWKSICDAKQVLNRGIRWRVGNGQSIRVWKDKWIPRPQLFKPIQIHNPNLNEELMVSDLISNSGQWNRSMLDEYFLEMDREIIEKIPISISGATDKIMWHYEKKGAYTVKSGYYVALDLLAPEQTPESSSNNCWVSDMWKLGIPLKIKHLAWRIWTDSLPTLHNLYRRNVTEANTCPLCNLEPESTTHAFRDCVKVRSIWKDSNLLSCPSDWAATLGKIWIEDVSEANGERMEVFLTVCWLIWYTRNKTVFNGEVWDATNIISRAEDIVRDYKETVVTSVVLESSSAAPAMKWVKPPASVYKVNFDASWSKDDGSVRSGAVIRDETGDFFAGLSCPTLKANSVQMAELLAGREAIKLAYEAGFRNIILEGDNVNAMNAIQNSEVDHFDGGAIIEDILWYAARCNACSFSAVKRSCNRVADLFASKASLYTECIIWLEDPPEWAVNIILEDS